MQARGCSDPVQEADRLSELESKIGHRFTHRDLLRRGLTHASHRGEAGLERLPEADNEQLEFLGDAVLGLAVSDHLYRSCPDFDEGRLSNVKSQIVSRTHLVAVARALGIGDFLVMGRAEDRSGGREKASLLANGLEAVLGAIYLDGGYDAARRFVLERIVGDVELRVLAAMPAHNVKTSLEMLARSRDLPKPEYSVRSENTGFPQMFAAEVRVGKDLVSQGRASSKKKAESAAAQGLLERLQAEESRQGSGAA